MSSTATILQYQPSGSSGTGVSYYTSATTCSRKAQLDKQQRALFADYHDEDTFGADVGSIFHSFAEVYYGKGRRDVVMEHNNPQLNPVISEAERLFQAYSERFSATELGEVLFVEKLIPDREEQQQKIVEALGINIFTMRVDLVTHMTASTIAALAETRPELVDLTPGVYLVDHKTKKSRDRNDALRYRYSTQFIAYQYVWNTVMPPELHCVGMIANNICRHKNLTQDSFYSIFVPYPSNRDIVGLKRYLQYAATQDKTDVPNWAACFNFRPCPYLVNGLCDRT